MIVGIDVGGTFTDVACWDGRRVRTAKVPTTRDQSDGVLSGARSLLPPDSPVSLLHGTTVATNALLERRGALTALVTDAGFEDVLEIGRQDRPSLYDVFADRPAPLVPATRRFGVPAQPSVEELEAVATAVAASGAEAVAVSLLRSYRDPETEAKLRSALRRIGAVSLSSEVAPEFREFERTSTTVLNAYLTPVASAYLRRLTDRLRGAGLGEDIRMIRSSGGLIGLEEAAALPAAILLSGPAGGAVAAATLGRALGRSRLISFDMGGTSTDVCRIEAGEPAVGYERSIDGFPCRFPSVAVHTVGAGGGSVGWVDPGGALRVGPQSAGANPGPACYGLGGVEATVTDANLLLGRLPASGRLAGEVRLDEALAGGVLSVLGGGLGMETEATAQGIVSVVEAHMERAIRTVSVSEGVDPRGAALLAFGGAGGLHATALARRLEMPGVVIPPHAGVFSALGLLLSAPRGDAARSVLLRPSDGARLDAELIAATGRLRPDGATVRTLVDARYVGQSHETTVPCEPGEGWEALRRRFDEEHHTRNGFSRPGDPIEVVTVRAEAVGRPAVTWDDLPAPHHSGEPRRGDRTVSTLGGPVVAEVWWRPGLAPGDEVVGPAVIEEPEATTWLGPDERALVHPSAALLVEW